MAARQIVTLAQMQQLVLNRLANSPFWTTNIASGSAFSEITFYINYALRCWQSLTGYWKERVTFQTAPTSPYYDLPRSMSMAMRVTANGLPLFQADVFSWDQGFPGWEGIPGKPAEWAPVGINVIAIRPVDYVGGISLVVDGLSKPPILTSPGDFIDIGQEEFNTLIGEIAHMAAFKEGGVEFKATIPLHVSFLKSAAILNERLRANAHFRNAIGISEDENRKKRRVKASELAPVGER